VKTTFTANVSHETKTRPHQEIRQIDPRIEEKPEDAS